MQAACVVSASGAHEGDVAFFGIAKSSRPASESLRKLSCMPAKARCDEELNVHDALRRGAERPRCSRAGYARVVPLDRSSGPRGSPRGLGVPTRPTKISVGARRINARADSLRTRALDRSRASRGVRRPRVREVCGSQDSSTRVTGSRQAALRDASRRPKRAEAEGADELQNVNNSKCNRDAARGAPARATTRVSARE